MRRIARFAYSAAVGLALTAHCGHLAAQPIEAEQDRLAVLTPEEGLIVLEAIVLTAEEQVKQAPGVSQITAEDLAVAPPVRDLSEIVRKMPGVNLTGNSPSGARGNNRQIDIRGMGPENTLILVDGKPVLSRNSVRYSMQGERDTRGDSNWVAPELIDRIEVLRGPAAARYGSGASGGVVNIVTKRPDEAGFSLSAHLSQPQDDKEGASRRTTFTAAGPLTESLGYRASAGVSWTEPDKPDLNGPVEEVPGRGGVLPTARPAGREGVTSYNLSGALTWDLDEANRFDLDASWSQQRNKYAGDVPWGGAAGEPLLALARSGAETNRMTRTALGLSHSGLYGFGSTESVLQWEHTENRRMDEGMAGGPEGTIQIPADGSPPVWSTSKQDVFFGRSEAHIPLSFGFEQMLTLGVDARFEKLDDPRSVGAIDLPDGSGWGTEDGDTREKVQSSWSLGVYVEDNLYLPYGLVLTPGLRLDQHERAGFNASPSLNLSWEVTPEITLKGGIARAFKAPNAYQLNPNYVYNSRGNGCLPGRGPCYILGNPDLSPEISLNKEIGINYATESGWNAGVTWFHNNYDNRITTGKTLFDTHQFPGQVWDPVRGAWVPGLSTADLMRWENGGPAVISGLEGNLSIPVLDNLTASANFTKMVKTEDASGRQLSLIPDHTINANLEWRPTDDLRVNLSATHYGEIEPLRMEGGAAGDPDGRRPAYWIANLGLSYDVNEHAQIVAGVQNLLDEQLLRSGEGANSFNEPGRSFYVGVTARW